MRQLILGQRPYPRDRALRACLTAVLCLAGGLGPAAIRASAATFSVDRTDDLPDEAPGDGLCETAIGGCSLRAAVEEANATVGEDTVLLPAASILRTLPTPIILSDDIRILGQGSGQSLVEGGGGLVVDSGSAELRDLALLNGQSFGVENRATLILVDVVLQGNAGRALINLGTATAERVTIQGQGTSSRGAIEVVGFFASLTLIDSLVTGNTSLDENGAGAVYVEDGMLTVRGSTLSANSGDLGGAIFQRGAADSEIVDSVLSGNSARFGGAIYVEGGVVRLDSSTVDQNSATLGAGAFFVNSGATLDVQATLLSANTSQNGQAVLLNQGETGFTNVTVSGSSGSSAAELANVPTMGVLSVFSSTLRKGPDSSSLLRRVGQITLADSILSGAGTGPACEGAVNVISLGHNLEDGDSCGLIHPSDLVLSDPGLEPLADNGGPSLTHGLLPGSPAVDAADPNGCPLSDQRGFARPVDGDFDGSADCDIGAFELVPNDPNACGDVDGNGQIAADDVDVLRDHLADPVGLPLSPSAAARCNVIGVPRPCDVLDVVVLRRALAPPPLLAPGIAPVCLAAGG